MKNKKEKEKERKQQQNKLYYLDENNTCFKAIIPPTHLPVAHNSG